MIDYKKMAVTAGLGLTFLLQSSLPGYTQNFEYKNKQIRPLIFQAKPFIAMTPERQISKLVLDYKDKVKYFDGSQKQTEALQKKYFIIKNKMAEFKKKYMMILDTQKVTLETAYRKVNPEKRDKPVGKIEGAIYSARKKLDDIVDHFKSD